MSRAFVWLRLLLGLAITAIFVWFVIRATEPRQLGLTLISIPGWVWLAGLMLLVSGYFFRILRWWLMLRALDPSLPFRACIGPFVSSVAVNNVVPFRAGDALRVFGFRRQLQAPAMRVLGTVLAERLLDLLALLAFFFVGLWFLGQPEIPRSLILAAAGLAGSAALLLIALVLGLPRMLPWMRRWIDGTVNRRPRWVDVMDRHGSHLVASFDGMRSAHNGLVLISCSIACWLLEGAIFAVVAFSTVEGLHLYTGWFAMSLGTLATLLPSTPGYVGTFDYFTMQGLIAFGSQAATAAAIAIAVHLILWLPLTIAGLVYLLGSCLHVGGLAELRSSTGRPSQHG